MPKDNAKRKCSPLGNDLMIFLLRKNEWRVYKNLGNTNKVNSYLLKSGSKRRGNPHNIPHT